MTQVLLIEPPTPDSKYGIMRIMGSIGSLKMNVKYPPLDMMIIGGLLRKNGIDFEIVDALSLKMDWKQVRNVIKKHNPEAVVFNSTVPTMHNDVKVAKIAKQINPDIKTIAINLIVRMARRNYLEKYPSIDFMPYIDHELPVLNLIKNNYKPRKVKGIYYREGKRVIKNKGGLCTNLDQLGIPAHDKVPLKIYNDPVSKRKPMTTMICSRGCVNLCHHCLCKFINPFRVRSVDSIIEELHFIEDLGIKEIFFWDCELPPNIEWGETLFKRMIKEKFDLTWSSNIRSDCVSYKVLNLMKKAGCHTVKMGADSSSQEILDNMNKNEDVKVIERAARDVKRSGLRLMTYCTMGHKGETKETMTNTIDWVTNKLKPEFTTFSIAIPVYGTVFYNYLEKNRYLNKNISNDKFDPSFEAPYNYVDRMEKEGLPDLTSEEMYQLSQWGYRQFYLRPSFMIKRLLTTNDLLGDIMHRFFYFLSLYWKEPKKRNKN